MELTQQLSFLEMAVAAPSPLPSGILGEMVEVFGWDLAVLVCRRFGGHEVYFPATSAPWLAEIVGEAKAQAWANRHPGERFYVPKGVVALRKERNRRIHQLREAGLTICEIERRIGLCRAQIYAILACPILDTIR